MKTFCARYISGFGAALLLIGALPSSAAVFVARVGDDAACGFRTSVLSNALQSAIDAVPVSAPEGDLYVIRVARSGDYVGTRVTIEDRSLVVEGGFATCSSLSGDSTNTTIDAVGLAGGPVRVRGIATRENVGLSRLSLRGGSGTSGSGVRIENADVILNRVIATDNSSLRGGGIQIDGTGLGAGARLTGGTQIVGNTATQEGGGIYCGRNGILQIESSVAVGSNTAMDGGGIFLNGCSGHANSGAHGIGGLFTNIGFNTATFGGGAIFARSTLGITAFIIGAGLDADDPAPLLVNNEAATSGGAIFATGDDTLLSINDAVIRDNTAGSIGGGIVSHGGATVLVTRRRAQCPRGDRCSEISGNTAGNSGGAAIAMFGGLLTIRGSYIERNSAATGSAITVQSGNAQADVHNSVIAENEGGSSVFMVRQPTAGGPDFRARLILSQSTITRNLDATRVIEVNDPGTVRVSHSIVQEIAAMPVFQRPAAYIPETDCSMLHEIVSAGSVDPHTFAFSLPGFVDAAAGNYRLRPNSEATDRCPTNAGNDAFDFEGDPRPFDGPMPNFPGTYDMGFDEYNDRIFVHGFESAP
jgi:predicted outer membrane repeat protein